MNEYQIKIDNNSSDDMIQYMFNIPMNINIDDPE